MHTPLQLPLCLVVFFGLSILQEEEENYVLWNAPGSSLPACLSAGLTGLQKRLATKNLDETQPCHPNVLSFRVKSVKIVCADISIYYC